MVPLAEFGGFDHGSVYMTAGLLATGRVHLSQRGKRIFAQELVGIIESFKPDLDGERHTTKFARDKPGGHHSSV